MCENNVILKRFKKFLGNSFLKNRILEFFEALIVFIWTNSSNDNLFYSQNIISNKIFSRIFAKNYGNSYVCSSEKFRCWNLFVKSIENSQFRIIEVDRLRLEIPTARGLNAVLWSTVNLLGMRLFSKCLISPEI